MNNKVELIGEITSEYKFSHSYYGENFYTTHIKIQRASGTYDTLRLLVSDKVINTDVSLIGKCVSVSGNIRTYNKQDEEKVHLLVFIYVEEMDLLELDLFAGVNVCNLNGTLCKINDTRITGTGRVVCDAILAVNRLYDKTDYIPIIAWGKNAKFLNGLSVGNKVQVSGRIQSRNYVKNNVEFTVYEVSAQNISSRLDVVPTLV